MNVFLNLWQYLGELLLEWEMFQIKVLENFKINILCSIIFFSFRKSCLLWDNVEKFGGAREAANDNVAARCVLD
jgi:hypothetical protein